MYKYFEALSSTSTSTPAEIKSIRKYGQVLSNMYINVFKLAILLTFGTWVQGQYTSWNQGTLTVCKVQVLSKTCTHKYFSTSTHLLGPMSAIGSMQININDKM